MKYLIGLFTILAVVLVVLIGVMFYERPTQAATIIFEFNGDVTPAGVLDGKNPTFTLPTVPNPASSLQLFRNGLRQKRGADYTISGSTITFVPLALPKAGDILIADYRF